MNYQLHRFESCNIVVVGRVYLVRYCSGERFIKMLVGDFDHNTIFSGAADRICFGHMCKSSAQNFFSSEAGAQESKKSHRKGNMANSKV